MSNKTELKKNFKNGELKVNGFKTFKLLNVKKLLIVFAAFTLSSGAFAQEKMDKKMGKMDKTEKMDMKKDHIMMMDGKMQMMKNGKTIAMDKDMTLSNGTKVSMDGTVKMKSGKTMMMKEGDMMYMNGKMSKM